jgi:hypothetical protein
MGLIDGGRTVTNLAVAQGAAGSTDLVAAVAGMRIVVVAAVLIADGAGTLKFQSGGATDLTGPMKLADTGGFVAIGETEMPLFWCAVGEKLNIVSSVSKMNGWIRYLLSPS